MVWMVTRTSRLALVNSSNASGSSHREIDVHLLRPQQVIARAVSERAGDRVGKCRRIIPTVLVGIGQKLIRTGKTVEPRAIRREDDARRIISGGLGHGAALQRGNRAQLPAAHHLVHDTAVIQKLLAFAERQSVEDGRHEAVRFVESRRAVFAGMRAERVLGDEVIPGTADGAAVIERLGIGVANKVVRLVPKRWLNLTPRPL